MMKYWHKLSLLCQAKHLRILRIGLSTIACLLILARFIWPEGKIDAVTIGLLIVAVLPWASFLLTSAKFPGGWEVRFRDLHRAGEMILPKLETVEAEADNQTMSAPLLSTDDPNLALVSLRIEIERRLCCLAELNGVQNRRSIAHTLNELRRRQVIRSSTFSGLQELVSAGDQAAHGALVEPGGTDWALMYGPQVLATLDAAIKEQGPGKS